MSTSWFKLLTTGFVAALLSGGVALAAPEGGDKPDRPKRERVEKEGERPQREAAQDRARGDFIAALFQGIELNDEQKSELREIAGSHREEVKAWHDENREKFEAIRTKMRDARKNKDRDAAEAAHEELEALMATRPKPDATFDAMRDVLATDADKATFDENLAKLKERLKERRENLRERAEGKDRPEGKRPKDGEGKARPEGERPKRGGEGGGLDI